MTDVEAVLRAHLVAQSTPKLAALYALTGERVHAGTHLPAGYDPSVGPALLFAVRGGGQDYSSAILEPSVQYQCYGATEALARQLYRALYDAVNDEAGAGIQQSRLETQGQLLNDPETQWPFVLAAFRHWIRNS